MPRKCKNVLDTAIAREQSTSVPELPDNQYVLEMSSSTQYQDACRDRHLEQIFNLCIEQGVLPSGRFYAILQNCSSTPNSKNTKLEALIEEFKMDSRADALLLAQKNDEINQLKIKLKN